MATFPFPLYHGTSTLFLEEIKKEGLGKTDIVQKYDLIYTLSKLYEKLKSNSENWDENDEREKIIRQRADGGNWQHGKVFLTASERKAISYARSSNYGSEIVWYIVKTYEEILKQGINIQLDNNFINSILEKTFQPVVLKLKNVPIEILQSDSHDSIEQIIEDIKKYGTEKRISNIYFTLKEPFIISNDNCEILVF